MTEKDYIKALDLGLILCVKDCLNRITPTTSEIIDEDEYRQVSKILAKWLQEHFDSMKVTDVVINQEKNTICSVCGGEGTINPDQELIDCKQCNGEGYV